MKDEMDRTVEAEKEVLTNEFRKKIEKTRTEAYAHGRASRDPAPGTRGANLKKLMMDHDQEDKITDKMLHVVRNQLGRELHPDKNTQGSERVRNELRMQEINAAYDKLVLKAEQKN